MDRCIASIKQRFFASRKRSHTSLCIVFTASIESTFFFFRCLLFSTIKRKTILNNKLRFHICTYVYNDCILKRIITNVYFMHFEALILHKIQILTM